MPNRKSVLLTLTLALALFLLATAPALAGFKPEPRYGITAADITAAEGDLKKLVVLANKIDDPVGDGSDQKMQKLDKALTTAIAEAVKTDDLDDLAVALEDFNLKTTSRLTVIALIGGGKVTKPESLVFIAKKVYTCSCGTERFFGREAKKAVLEVASSMIIVLSAKQAIEIANALDESNFLEEYIQARIAAGK